ncbi:MAG: hypothetical protein J6C19_05140 [Lachnospiraceae bacterium]|nr:hypothetical protein [Lachnospiraceae bacterium]
MCYGEDNFRRGTLPYRHCPKCRQEILIDTKGLQVTVIKRAGHKEAELINL